MVDLKFEEMYFLTRLIVANMKLRRSYTFILHCLKIDTRSQELASSIINYAAIGNRQLQRLENIFFVATSIANINRFLTKKKRPVILVQAK